MLGRRVQRALELLGALPLLRVLDDREVQDQLPHQRHDDLRVPVHDVHRVCARILVLVQYTPQPYSSLYTV